MHLWGQDSETAFRSVPRFARKSFDLISRSPLEVGNVCIAIPAYRNVKGFFDVLLRMHLSIRGIISLSAAACGSCCSPTDSVVSQNFLGRSNTSRPKGLCRGPGPSARLQKTVGGTSCPPTFPYSTACLILLVDGCIATCCQISHTMKFLTVRHCIKLEGYVRFWNCL